MMTYPPLIILHHGASLERGGIANHVLTMPLSKAPMMAEAVEAASASRAEGRKLS